jgi:hypothetical protein
MNADNPHVTAVFREIFREVEVASHLDRTIGESDAFHCSPPLMFVYFVVKVCLLLHARRMTEVLRFSGIGLAFDFFFPRFASVNLAKII